MVHVATMCEESQELAQEALMVLRPGGSTMTVLFFSAEGLADLVTDWVVVTRAGLVHGAIVQRPQH
jgi:hypothetical protein